MLWIGFADALSISRLTTNDVEANLNFRFASRAGIPMRLSPNSAIIESEEVIRKPIDSERDSCP